MLERLSALKASARSWTRSFSVICTVLLRDLSTVYSAGIRIWLLRRGMAPAALVPKSPGRLTKGFGTRASQTARLNELRFREDRGGQRGAGMPLLVRASFSRLREFWKIWNGFDN